MTHVHQYTHRETDTYTYIHTYIHTKITSVLLTSTGHTQVLQSPQAQTQCHIHLECCQGGVDRPWSSTPPNQCAARDRGAMTHAVGCSTKPTRTQYGLHAKRATPLEYYGSIPTMRQKQDLLCPSRADFSPTADATEIDRRHAGILLPTPSLRLSGYPTPRYLELPLTTFSTVHRREQDPYSLHSTAPNNKIPRPPLRVCWGLR